MFSSDSTNRRLGPLSEDCLRVILQETENGAGITRSEAIAAIKAANDAHDDRLWSSDAANLEREIDEVLRDLINWGYLYEAKGELRVTERDVLE